MTGAGGVERLRLIGYWDGPMAASGWPDVRGFVDGGWDRWERENVANYLTQGFVFRAFGGLSTCRFCGIGNGGVELTDGSWYWPEGLAHYLTDHGVRLPQVFMDHVNSELELLEDVSTDTDWWKAQDGFKA